VGDRNDLRCRLLIVVLGAGMSLAIGGTIAICSDSSPPWLTGLLLFNFFMFGAIAVDVLLHGQPESDAS
jgi:hypothetical protein